jgi:hypothetical protein
MYRLFPLFVLLLLTLGVLAQPKKKGNEAPPKPLYSLQLAIDPGKTTKLTLRGLRFEEITEIRLQEPKSRGKLLGKSRKVGVSNQMNVEQIGDYEIDVEVTLPKEVPGGLIALSLVGPGGASPLMNVLVNDDTPRVGEKEPNDGFKQAQVIAVPQIVEASIKQNQDVDVYKIEAQEGQSFRIEVQAARVGSPVDALLTLYDAAGRIIATGETSATQRDPVMTITLKKAGVYFIGVLDNHDQGGAMFNYRLAIRPVVK